jgi:hypothetical protein
MFPCQSLGMLDPVNATLPYVYNLLACRKFLCLARQQVGSSKRLLFTTFFQKSINCLMGQEGI